MVKQRRESIRQYTDAGRLELAEQEQFEINVIQEYLPQTYMLMEVLQKSFGFRPQALR